MKKFMMALFMMLSMSLFLNVNIKVNANSVIEDGIYIEEFNIGGLTATEAKQEVYKYVEQMAAEDITFVFYDGETIVKTLSEFDLVWINPSIVEEAVAKSQASNIVQRYKVKEDIANEQPVYTIQLGLNQEAIKTFLEEEGTQFDIDVKNTDMTMSNGQITVTSGQSGYALDVENSLVTIVDYITSQWDKEATEIAMIINEIEPLGSSTELKQLTSVLGSFTTSYTSSAAGRCTNIQRGAELINGTLVYPGETFSAQDMLNPITVANGYDIGGSYVSGKIVDSVGGGVCQVSTTLYNAVLYAELEVTERYNHSMTVSYVEQARDAAISNSAGKDFKFVNNTDTPVYIEGYTEGKTITFNIYGVETRDENRVVTYETEITSTISPGAEIIYADASQSVGYIATQSAYTGYKSKLWKIVTVNGVEESRTLVNTSNYSASPRQATVGVAATNPDYYNQIMAAIGTGSIDHVRSVISSILATEAAASAAVEVPDI